ncbi:MAG: Do family serine endopeptidase [Candidatus Aminicenantes bacterium]|nr:Do family serine endopeptidase [Candidatus Aminicenantes bacterium]
MKKIIWIGIIGFLLGIIVSGYVFIYLPERQAAQAPEIGSGAPLLTSSLNASPARPSPETRGDLDFVSIAEKVGPAVVKIVAERIEKVRGFGFDEGMPFDDFWERFFGSPRSSPREQEVPAQAQGTGFFVSEDGYILTNNHIVENAVDVRITALQGEDYKAKIIGTDPRSDLALLKVETEGLLFLRLGDSEQLKVGEWVLAVGNPYGLEHTVTSGIVSAKGRQLGLGGNVPDYQDFIQTDAAINRGNSGGPLVNMQGEVIGITSNIFSPSGGNIGLGFAIPANLARKVITQLKEKGRVVRGRIGITMPVEPLTDEDKEAFKLKDKKGALVNSVEQGAPADKAGIEPYDVIVEVDGEKIDSPNDLKFKIADAEPGKKIDIKVIRDGKEQTFTVTVEELDPPEKKEEPKASGKDLGFTVRELSPSVARRYGLTTQEGLIITQVKRYSEADRKGLTVGDIIIEVNRRRVTTVDELEKIMNQIKSGEAIILLLRREQDGQPFDRIVTLRVP